MITLRILFLFIFLPFHHLLAQKLLVIFPDTMENEARMRSNLRNDEPLEIYYHPISSNRPVGSEDILEIIRTVHAQYTLDYVLLAGPLAAIPFAPTPFGEESDFLYSLPDSNRPTLVVGRIPANTKSTLRRYFENRLHEDHIDSSLVYLMNDPGDANFIESYRKILKANGIRPLLIHDLNAIQKRALAFIFLGEGSPYGWLGSHVERKELQKLKRFPSVVISISCSSASVFDPQSMAYHFLFSENGSRAFLGCSGYCLHEESALFGEYLLTAFDPGRPMGEIVKEAARLFLSEAALEAENKIMTVSGFMLLGDPSLSPIENRRK